MFFSQSEEEYEVGEKFTFLLRVDEFSGAAREKEYEVIINFANQSLLEIGGFLAKILMEKMRKFKLAKRRMLVV